MLHFLAPIFLGISAAFFPLVAQSQATKTFADWFLVNADDSSGDVIVGTPDRENGDEVLVVRCFAKEQVCIHALRLKTGCENGASYPFLMNHSTGANLVRGICRKNGDANDMAIEPFDTVRAPLDTNANILGFAIPLASGAFRAVRFSLNGAKTAIQEAERLVRQRKPNERSVKSGTF